MNLDRQTLTKLKLFKKAKKAQRKLRSRGLTKQQRDSLKTVIAKAMVAFPTPAEESAKPELCKMGFRQQYQVCGYIADFAHEEKRVIVELDGAVHLQQKDYDQYRDKVLSDHGWLVIRCPNSMVSRSRAAFLSLIRKAVL